MAPPRALVVGLIILSAPLAGCIGSDDDVASTSLDAVRCVHPHPCGDEWPVDLVGPFAIMPAELVRVPSHDGVELEGALWMPDVPDGTKLPVVLTSIPYVGHCSIQSILALAPSCGPRQDDPALIEWSHRTALLVEAGYAVAIFSVRGTGGSGGCFEFFGPNEQLDQAFLVEWLAEQDWSNGRVAMWGLSYMGTTPWMAAIQAPPALKTIVAAGIVSDAYQFSYGPQGAPIIPIGAFVDGFIVTMGLAPPVGAPLEAATVGYAEHAPERLCPEVARMMVQHATEEWIDDRNQQYWDDRRLIDGFSNITAATFIVHGLWDNSGHAYQEDVVWNAIPDETPKHMLLGQWAHTISFDRQLQYYPGGDAFTTILVAWFDHWLKGIGSPERVGIADYQDSARTWHKSASWPPAEARPEVLYASDGALAPAPGTGAVSFRAPAGHITGLLGHPMCENAGTTILFGVEATAPVRIAGNPMAYLSLSSDLPGGTLGVDLFDLGPDDACDEAEWVAGGAADLRFYQGNFAGIDFPTGTPTPVRVDLFDTAWTLEPGHQLVLALAGTGWRSNSGQPYYPEIIVHGDASHLVLPIVEGTFGGSAPTMEYPPRPFEPA